MAVAEKKIGRPRKVIPPHAPAKKSGATVTVACHWPLGLQLRVFKPTLVSEQVMGGGRKEVTEYHPTGDVVLIHGPGREIGADPKAPLSGGAALTYGVDADFFDLWLKQNAEHPAVKNKLIYARASTEQVVSDTKEMAGVRTGLEPINQDGDKRINAKAKKLERA